MITAANRLLIVGLAAFSLASAGFPTYSGADESAPFTVLSARDRGVFNIGASKGGLAPISDSQSGREVLKLEYSAPAGSMVGVWTKNYPSDLKSSAVNAVVARIKTADAAQVRETSLTIELKGSKDVQRIPIALQAGWASAQEFIEWDKIGDLKEAVFVVGPSGSGHAAAGTLYFDLEFVKKTRPKKTIPSTFTLQDGRERGIFNIGPAQGELAGAAGAPNLVEFNYSAMPGSVIGVWTKGYPSELSPASVNAVKASVKTSGARQVHRVSAVLELKGSKDVQKIPLRLRPGWSSHSEFIRWDTLGALKEAVFVVTPTGGGRPERGTMLLGLEFEKLASLPVDPAAVPSTFNILDAGERGAFAIGGAKGALGLYFDEKLQEDVLKFDYVSSGTAAGLWSKGYAPELSSSTADAVQISVNVPDSAQAGRVAVTVEIKGTAGTQGIPVHLKQGWSRFEDPIDWNLIGALQEAVFVVSPLEAGKVTAGTLYASLNFIRSSDWNAADSAEEAPPVGLSDAGTRGTSILGDAKGEITPYRDPEVGDDALKLDYSAATGAVVSVWNRKFPAPLLSGGLNAFKIGVKSMGAKTGKVLGAVEIRGTRSIQKISLRLGDDWDFVQSAIDWKKIGRLREVTFVVSSAGAERAEGTLHFYARFSRLSGWAGFSTSAIGQIILVFAAGLLLAFAASLFARKKPLAAQDVAAPKSAAEFAGSHFGSDLVYGISATLAIGSALTVYHLGTLSAFDAGFRFLAVGIAGAVIAGLLKRAITGDSLSPSEVFQNVFISGLLAVSSSDTTLLQAPSVWGDLLRVSNLTAALAFLIYHAVNAGTLSSSGKHLRAASGAIIAGTPYLFGWLLLLEKTPMLQNFGGAFAGGLIVVFIFNEIFAAGVSLASKGKLMKDPKGHLSLFLISLGVCLAPIIADLGSGAAVAHLYGPLRSVASILCAALSQAGLWGEAYFLTGMILDAVCGGEISAKNISNNIRTGARKGLAYSGMFMALLHIANLLISNRAYEAFAGSAPLLVGLILGAVLFPLGKTIIETFDGSTSFFERANYNYKNPVLFARGAMAGFGLALAATRGLFDEGTSGRLLFGLGAGLAASVGISLVRDAIYASGKRGRIQGWRIYAVDAIMGGFIGTMAAFYLDAAQVPMILNKFKLYLSAGLEPQHYSVYPLLSKWGGIDLGTFTGGARLLFNESLAGVIGWSVGAWLFAINRAFLQAFFQKDKAPIQHLFSRNGFMDLTQHMIHVLRWGLWMSPIINTFLRMMGEATWYNQDGAIRSLFAIFNNATMSSTDFQTWSLNFFIAILSFDALRILIWLDHMGLRVATLVNLSFIGMDRLDDRIARFIGPAAAQRYIPEAVKRFTTWAPLLIPFYIPRGENWDYAWNKSIEVQAANQGGGFVTTLASLGAVQLALLAAGAVFLITVVSFLIRGAQRRSEAKKIKDFELGNMEYRVTQKLDGSGFSQITQKNYDISRRTYDTLDPCGRILFITDTAQKPDGKARLWPVIGNYPKDLFPASKISKQGDALQIVNENNGIRTTLNITLPETYTTAELWTVTVENLADQARELKIVPYLEWVLDKPDADRGHTQYARLFPEMQYAAAGNAVLTWQKNTKSMGILASETAPEGFQVSRLDFIGRAKSIWTPRLLETLNFLPAKDTAPYPTFDPVGSLFVNAALAPKASRTFRFLIGAAKSKAAALDLIQKYLKPQAGSTGTGSSVSAAAASASSGQGKHGSLIGHGEILPGTPQPYYTFNDEGNTLSVKTPYTPRPYDHAMSNALGHSVMVTNRGLHTSSNGNSQQNRLTPDWPDLVTREIPGEAMYIYDPEANEWYSPTHHPLNDPRAKNESDFGVDGTSVFRMTRDDLSTELTVFVPPAEPVGVYILKIKNNSDRAKNLRVASYFQIVLAGQPEWSGVLDVKPDAGLNAVFFDNPRNTFRIGPAFAATSVPAQSVATERGQFFGEGRSCAHPAMVQEGRAAAGTADRRPVAGSLSNIQVPARGEASIVVVLGQADDRKQASEIIRKYKTLEGAQRGLEETRSWWLKLMGTLRIQSNKPEFDHLQNWLKYQAVAERIWPRRGFYQTSGAFGFRDQLQDSVNLIWVDPAFARKQIILHASQQFLEGDVVHWFHTLYDGRTAFSNRSHASDNLLWLPWAAGEYVKLSGDETLLDEVTSYLQSDLPFPPLPRNKHGWGTIYLRSARMDTVYRHCMKSIDLVLEKRMGKNGIPLIGTGDWNDGLDEIGSEGRGESIWLGFFIDYILKNLLPIIEKKDGKARRAYYEGRLKEIEAAVEKTWRGDRYLRAIHDDGTEIGVKDSGIWEIDALTAAWSVMSGINPERGEIIFNAALKTLEKENVILLGWPALREDTKPYLGRSSHYPEGVRENGMYCHGDQWLTRAARLLAERYAEKGDNAKAAEYRAAAWRIWYKISPIMHMEPKEIEIYGGQPNKQAADLLTTFDQGRMIWHGYTGAAGWMLRQAMESVIGAKLNANKVSLPGDLNETRGDLKVNSVQRDLAGSPLKPAK